MRHKVAGYKLGRTTAHRRSLLRNMTTSLIMEERVETTVTKAKALRPTVEKMITLGKRGDLAARRQAHRSLKDAKRSPSCSTPSGRVSATATAATCASSAPDGARATAPKPHSSSFWAAKKCRKKSARSAPKPAPSAPPKPRKPWTKRKRSRIKKARAKPRNKGLALEC